MCNDKIICGKFDNIINIDPKMINNQKIRIGSINPNTLKKQVYIPIATNGNKVLYKDKIFDIRNFLSLYKKKIKSMIVLTNKEKELILEELVDFSLDIKVFERIYPIFSHIRYISNMAKNYNELKELLSFIKSININGKSIAHALSTEYLFKVERKLRYKNKLDYFFAFAYKGGYSEVFKIKEERKDRVIISFDYNSMFIDSMLSNFIEPKSIVYKKFNDEVNLKKISTLYNGLYRVILKNAKNTFFNKFHPFKYVKLKNSFLFELKEKQSVELFLFKNEIMYYKKFFNDIEIIEGFFSKKEIRHPLEKYAKQTYKERLEYKNSKNKFMQELSKFKLITVHSSTNLKNFNTLFFKTKEEIINYISMTYMIQFPTDIDINQKISIIKDNKYFYINEKENGYEIKIINLNSHNTVFSLSSQILANSRLKMIKTIEKFISHNSVEICYTNIDSIHISIHKNEVNEFLKKYDSIISDKIGDLKIEAISERGYWFDIGRYWLFTGDNVDLFKNSFFNKKGNSKHFIRSRKLKFISKPENQIFNFVKTVYYTIDKAFSYNKKLIINNEVDQYNYKRYNYEEICNLDVAENSYNAEILKTKIFKINLYNRIATV